ncbi:MAG TPA: isochorismate synthase [Streptosporangiaceae bacterium]|nr:isochorismate synthase [Streptosporangiaceae bacterium]
MAVLSRQETGRLFVRSVAIPDPGDLLGHLPQPDAVAWVHHGAGLVGWGEAARVTLPAGDDRFTAGEKWHRSLFDSADIDDRVRVRGSGPVAFGTFTFDASSEGSALIVPRVLLGRDGHGQAWLTTVGAEREPDLRALGWPAAPESVLARPPAGVRWHDGSLPGPQWEHAVAEAVAAIKAGSLRKVVLAQDLFATASEPIDVRALLRRLAVRYPDCFAFACDGMVGATPELLIRQTGRQVSALVLAGTTPRGGDPAEDEALGAALLASAKNTEEHAYAVASMRETLEPLCEELESQPRPTLIKLPNLQHLGTWVRGTLTADGTPKSALGLAAAVHPTAAVCGTPTGTAFELIRELEHMDRERYAGPVGWVDADGNGEWGIALRCAQLSGRTARLFAGCGIVAGSDPAAELAEAQVKFRPMRGALEG